MQAGHYALNEAFGRVLVKRTENMPEQERCPIQKCAATSNCINMRLESSGEIQMRAAKFSIFSKRRKTNLQPSACATCGRWCCCHDCIELELHECKVRCFKRWHVAVGCPLEHSAMQSYYALSAYEANVSCRPQQTRGVSVRRDSLKLHKCEVVNVTIVRPAEPSKLSQSRWRSRSQRRILLRPETKMSC